jgi:hypothetical protein
MGILLMPCRTGLARKPASRVWNVQTNSEGSGLLGWYADSVTIADNNAASPTGTNTAGRMTLRTGTNTLAPYVNFGNWVNIIGSTTYNYSIYLKKGTGLYMQITLNGMAHYADFDLDAGAVGSNTGFANIAMTPEPYGYYRCSCSYTAGAHENFPIIAAVGSSVYGKLTTWTCAAETYYFWGSQISVGTELHNYQGVA